MRPTVGDARASIGIMMESFRLCEGIVAYAGLEPEKVSDWRLDGDYFIVGTAPPVLLVVAQGASLAADAVERLVGSGCQRIIRIGTCGGLREEQAIGDVVVIRAAVRDEGTSDHYLPRGFPAVADPALVDEVLAAVRGAGFDATPALSWTTDGRWTESDEAIRAFGSLGVAAVDMETAGLFAAATKRRARAASLSIVADKPIEHIGAEFKGLPLGRMEWDLVVASGARVLKAILARCPSWAATGPA